MSLPLGEDTRLWRSSGRQQRWVWPGRSGVCRPPPPPRLWRVKAAQRPGLGCCPTDPSLLLLVLLCRLPLGGEEPHAADPGAAPRAETRVGLHGEPNPIPMGTTTLSTGLAGKGLTADPREGNLCPASGAEGKVGEAGNTRKPCASGPLS